MKSIVFTAALTICCCTLATAQCGKKNVIRSSKTEFLNAAYTVEKVKDENAEILFDQASITISINGEDGKKITGVITAAECDWNTPYQEGKTIIKALMSDPGGAKMNATFTIEGKGSGVTLLMEVEDMNERKVKIKADSFGEKND